MHVWSPRGDVTTKSLAVQSCMKCARKLYESRFAKLCEPRQTCPNRSSKMFPACDWTPVEEALLRPTPISLQLKRERSLSQSKLRYSDPQIVFCNLRENRKSPRVRRTTQPRTPLTNDERIDHIPEGGRPLLREGGPNSYKARPSRCSSPIPIRAHICGVTCHPQTLLLKRGNAFFSRIASLPLSFPEGLLSLSLPANILAHASCASVRRLHPDPVASIHILRFTNT